MQREKRNIRLLLTCCLGYYMKETIACFKTNDAYDVTIIGTDMNPMPYNINGIDVFYQVPRSDAPEYFDVIFDIAKREHVNVVMPLHSKELVPFCEKRKQFEECGMLLAVPELEGLKIANDKILSYQYMRQMHIPTPLTLVTKSAEEAIAFLHEHKDETFVTKLSDSCGARGFHIVGGDALQYSAQYPTGTVIEECGLHNVIDGNTEVLLQTFLPGKEYTTDLVLQDGRCIAYYTKECALVEHGVIRQAKTVDVPEASSMCIRFAESLKLSGNIGFDLKCDMQGHPVIIDVNPRITATIALGRYAGLNLPMLGLETLLGIHFDGCRTAKNGIAIIRQITDYYFDEEGKPLF